MNTSTSLRGAHRRTYEAIFRHPLAHNLAWREVRSLFSHIGQIIEEPNGNLKVTRNGQTLVLRPPLTKDVAEASELMDLRHFLERSETPQLESPAGETHWLVVIDHHEARIFRSEIRGTEPLQILPHAPDDYFRHAHNSKDFTRGQEKPDPNSFFEPVAQALKAVGSILIFGSGKGSASEMEQFTAWLRRHHPEIDRRVIGSRAVDEHHLTEGQLLAKAREFFADRHSPAGAWP